MHQRRTLIAMGAIGAMAALAASPVHIADDGPRPRSRRRFQHTGVSRPQSNGSRETARRRRQIAAGQLTHTNGLV
jgi:hypothetical protein